MKTPKAAPKPERNALSTPSVKIGKNKKSGLQAKLDVNKAKLALNKSNPNLNVVGIKNVVKNNAVNPKSKGQVNGSPGKKLAKSAPTSPVGGNVGKKRKSNESTPNATPLSQPQGGKKKKGKVAQSPEVQLGLKIEKMLESPKGGKPPGDGAGKKKQKGPKPAGGAAQTEKPQAQPSSPGQGKKRKRNKKGKAGSPQAGVQNDSAPQGKQKQKEKTNVPKEKAPRVDEDSPIKLGDFPNRSSVEGALKALLADVKQRRETNPALLGDSDPIQVVVNFFKAHQGVRRLQRILLPHPHLAPDPDVIFFAADLKSAKAEPEESIEHHTTIFSEQGVTGISEIIPWRKLTKEYTQYEEKRKLVNRADAFLIDSRLAHRWPAMMRKTVMKRKAPVPLRTHPVTELKKNVDAALRKVTVLCKDNTMQLNVVVGHSKNKLPHLVDNVATVVAALCDPQRFVGGQPNVHRIAVKTARSESFPIFLSTVSPNAVAKPKAPKKKKEEVVTGEVTTAGVTVAVHPDGKIKIQSKDVDLDETEHDTSPKKKREAKKLGGDSEEEDESDDEGSDVDEDDSEDEEDSDDDIEPTLVKKFKSANTPSDDETSDDEEIDRAEQEFLLALRKQQDALETEAKAANAKAKKEASKSGKPVKIQADDEDESDEEEDDDGSSDEEEEDDDDIDDEEDSDDSDVPDLIPAKKPQAAQPQKGQGKPQGGIPQGGKRGQNGQPPKWKQQGNFQKGKGKGNSPQQKGGRGGKGGSPQQKGGRGKPFQKGNQKPNQQQGSPKGRYFNMKAGGKKN